MAAVPVSAAAAVPPSILELVLAVVPNSAAAKSEAAEIPATAAADAVAVPYGSRNLGLGGRPKGTTLANGRAAKLARKKAINWVVVKYAKSRSNLIKNNECSRRRITFAAQ